MKKNVIIFILVAVLAHNTCWCQQDERSFEFAPRNYFGQASLNMTEWIDKPAGKHGFLTFQGGDYKFEDGTPIKFWGVNIASDKPFVDSATATEWTKMLTKYGINSVRFHKFTWDATDGTHSTIITDDHWKNFDFFCKTLRDNGVYYSWSHIYGHKVLKGDSGRVKFYNEIANTKFPWSHLNGTTASLVNFAEDLQSLNIELTVNMLNHTNPLTGLRYADDPALAFIELQNEDNIFWGAIEETLKQTPSYKKLLSQKFSVWLKQKYKDENGLSKAWSNVGLEQGESLQHENIYPRPSHGYFSHEYELAIKENRDVPQHVADRAAFLYEQQKGFYTKFIEAIRNTGYKGVIIGSCWQAGSGLSHFFNLHADYLAGPIDRHNYFGGGSGHRFTTGKFDNTSMVSKPGSGLLSTGFQQVGDRPFQISEWMSLIPTEWVAESAPIVAAYGMGLQGWDASFAFAMDDPYYSKTIDSQHGIYNVTSPLQLALYPALSAMVYRGDVSEGKIIANRDIRLKDLYEGTLKLNEKTSQQYDVKSFESTTPLEALAIGKVTISFDERGSASKIATDRYWDKTSKTIRSTTGELEWHYGSEKYFTINTKGTQGIVGFAPNAKIDLPDIQLKTSNPFAVILVTALEKDKSIANGKRLLITVMARAKNTGMEIQNDPWTLTKTGTAPILIEPVVADLSFKRKQKARVHILDHVGNKTGKEIQVLKNSVVLDGNKYETIYYQVEFE